MVITDLELLLICVVRGAFCALLIALVARGLTRVFWSLSLYLVENLVFNLVAMGRPEEFWTYGFVLADRLLSLVLKTALLVELAWSLVRAFPGARITMRYLVMLVVALMIVTTIGTYWGVHSIAWLVYLGMPLVSRLSLVVGLGFIMVWMVTLWYHLPTHGVQRTLIRGFALLSIVQSLCAAILFLNWGFRDSLTYAEMSAFALTLSYCAWAVWRPAGEIGSTAVRALVSLERRSAKAV